MLEYSLQESLQKDLTYRVFCAILITVLNERKGDIGVLVAPYFNMNEYKENNIALVLASIKAVASTKVLSDEEDFNPMDASGGNFDDAYWMGVDDGTTIYAQNLLKMLEK